MAGFPDMSIVNKGSSFGGICMMGLYVTLYALLLGQPLGLAVPGSFPCFRAQGPRWHTSPRGLAGQALGPGPPAAAWLGGYA